MYFAKKMSNDYLIIEFLLFLFLIINTSLSIC